MNDEISSGFGELLLMWRKAAGWSQQTLSQRSGLSERTLRDLERGRAKTAQRRSVQLLADSLGLCGNDRAEFIAAAQEGRRKHEPVHQRSCPLPSSPDGFVGREAEIEVIREMARSGGTLAIVGQPGVGKTATAVFAAHDLLDRFPDGCFAVDLRGLDDKPTPTRSVLEQLLRALGIASALIPSTQEEQGNLYRTVLASRRVLVLLDNAWDESQVRPLLTDAPGCLTLITGRRLLAGLESVRWLVLDPLPRAAAFELLVTLAGEDRTGPVFGESGKLIDLCENLPLALQIVGIHLSAQDDLSIAELVAQLDDEHSRLSQLELGDLQVRSAFEVSYRRLPDVLRAVFRGLTAVPGADFGVELVKTAFELSEMEAWKRLDDLLETNLIQIAVGEGRFRFHDLLRIFAAERWETEESLATRERITNAVQGHLLRVAREAGLVINPGREDSGPFQSQNEAKEWLAVEGTNWVSAVRAASSSQRHREVVELAEAMHWYSNMESYAHPWVEICEAGLTAARALNDQSSEATLLNLLGWVTFAINRSQQTAVEIHQDALRLAIQSKNKLARIWALTSIGLLRQIAGDSEEALIMVSQSDKLSVGLDFWSVQLAVRVRMARVLLMQGRPSEALEIQRELMRQVRSDLVDAMPLARRRAVAALMEGIGLCLQVMECWEESAEILADAQRLHEGMGNTFLAAQAALGVGICLLSAGRLDEAEVSLTFALKVHEEIRLEGVVKMVKSALERLDAARATQKSE